MKWRGIYPESFANNFLGEEADVAWTCTMSEIEMMEEEEEEEEIMEAMMDAMDGNDPFEGRMCRDGMGDAYEFGREINLNLALIILLYVGSILLCNKMTWGV